MRSTPLTVLVSTRDAALHLGISVQAVGGLRRRKRLKAARTRPYLFKLSDVESYKLARGARRYGYRPRGVEIVHNIMEGAAS